MCFSAIAAAAVGAAASAVVSNALAPDPPQPQRLAKAKDEEGNEKDSDWYARQANRVGSDLINNPYGSSYQTPMVSDPRKKRPGSASDDSPANLAANYGIGGRLPGV